MSQKGANKELSGGLLLNKDQLKKILDEMTEVSFIAPGFFGTTEILPPFKKLGVLIDYEEIAEAKETKASRANQSNNSNVNANTAHADSYTCIQCRRHLPTAHLLDLHITEQHDMYFAASVERGDKPLFACYIEECPIKFMVPNERKDHCITVHKFPANYRFDQVKSNKVKNRKQKQANHSMEVDEDSAKSTDGPPLPYIKAFSFGQHAPRTFNTRSQRAAGSTLLDVQAINEALNELD